MSTKIDRREDVNPKEGMREDGDVEFADLTKEDRAAEQHASADAHNPATRRSQQRAKLVSPFLARIVRFSRAVRVLCARRRRKLLILNGEMLERSIRHLESVAL